MPILGALAYAGGVVAYLPFLTLLLPLRVEQLAGEDRIGVLATTLIAGAVMASLSGVIFGWLSDRSLERGGGRRRWIAFGLLATFLSYAAVAEAPTPATLIVAVMAFQLALNAVLAPLVALLAEETIDPQKGLMSGLLAGAPPFASAVGGLLVLWPASDLGIRLASIAAVTAVCVAPLLLMKPRQSEQTVDRAVAAPRRDLAVAWTSRLLVQVAGNVLFAYLLYYMEALASPAARAAVPVRVGELLVVAHVAPLPVAVILGRWSDRLGRRKPFLVATAALAATGLAVMGCSTGWIGAAVGFCLFAIGWGVFLPLQIGFVMQLLPNPRRRGRDLGLINLSNTAPVLIGPALTWWLATPRHFGPLLFTLAALSLAGGLAMLAVKERR
uniref:MFS transporter n=1 Tax=uncultured Sphingomonas sp. TaxID=158754 RepID=UPI0035C9A632